MMDKPPRELYLQTHDDDGDEVGEITFCYDRVYRCDIRYVRADIADDLLATLKAIEAREPTGGTDCVYSFADWACQTARAAIVKAESRAG